MDHPLSLLGQAVHNLLGPGGRLEQNLPGFEHRPTQLDMSRRIVEAVETNRHAVMEGGTGIGKTLAYLIPLLLSSDRLVVSTGTKTLQEQIFFKDLPSLVDHLDHPVKACLMKGRGNYICKLRLKHFSTQSVLPLFPRDREWMAEVLSWLPTTQTGDKAELANVPEGWPLWRDITASSETCLFRHCPLYSECYITKMRQIAQECNLVIVNHHLYFADLVSAEEGELIPSHNRVVFDEAHMLGDVATQFFSTILSDQQFQALSDDSLRVLGSKGFSRSGLAKTLDSIQDLSRQIFGVFQAVAEPRFTLDRQMVYDADIGIPRDELKSNLQIFADRLKELAEEESGGLTREEMRRLAGRSEMLATAIVQVLETWGEESVYWGEARPHRTTLASSPLDVAPVMHNAFFLKDRQALFTSATLASAGSFEFFKQQLGIPDDAIEGIFPSPFNYRLNSLLFIPRTMPEPSSDAFCRHAAETIYRLIRLSEGSALVLFTSYANLDQVFDLLKGRLPYPLFRQGDAPKGQLLDQFRGTVDSVLFATGSFWQGVDIVGESLRLVIIDKLPFEVPKDPILSARIEYLRQLGKNPFFDYQVPTAIIQLKQGVGRLIRSQTDWGVVSILDRRLVSKPYGARFLKSLPPFSRAEQFDQVETWWERTLSLKSKPTSKPPRRR